MKQNKADDVRHSAIYESSRTSQRSHTSLTARNTTNGYFCGIYFQRSFVPLLCKVMFTAFIMIAVLFLLHVNLNIINVAV